MMEIYFEGGMERDTQRGNGCPRAQTSKDLIGQS